MWATWPRGFALAHIVLLIFAWYIVQYLMWAQVTVRQLAYLPIVVLCLHVACTWLAGGVFVVCGTLHWSKQTLGMITAPTWIASGTLSIQQLEAAGKCCC